MHEASEVRGALAARRHVGQRAPAVAVDTGDLHLGAVHQRRLDAALVDLGQHAGEGLADVGRAVLRHGQAERADEAARHRGRAGRCAGCCCRHEEGSRGDRDPQCSPGPGPAHRRVPPSAVAPPRDARPEDGRRGGSCAEDQRRLVRTDGGRDGQTRAGRTHPRPTPSRPAATCPAAARPRARPATAGRGRGAGSRRRCRAPRRGRPWPARAPRRPRPAGPAAPRRGSPARSPA